MTAKRRIAVMAAAALGALLWVTAASAETAQVEDISDRYFDVVHAELKGATQSVWVAMYEIRVYEGKKSNKAYVLLQDLVDAHRRGVEVEVFLDRSFRYSGTGESGVLHDRNDLAEQLLKNGGVSVTSVGPKRRLHAKLIVIDKALVVEGSVNWSQWALTRNIESASLIRSAEYAGRKLEWVAKLRSTRTFEQKIAKKAKGRETWSHDPGVQVGQEFVVDEGLGPRMVSKHDERAFDVYLLLVKRDRQNGFSQSSQRSRSDAVGSRSLSTPDRDSSPLAREMGETNYNGHKEAQKTQEDELPSRMIKDRMIRAPDEGIYSSNSTLVVDYEEMAEALGIKGKMGRTAYRRQITKTLRKLEKTYGLVKCEFAHGKSASVRLRRTQMTQDRRQKAAAEHATGGIVSEFEQKIAKVAKKRGIRIPEEYWEYGWDRKLSLKGKFMYLVSLRETAMNPGTRSEHGAGRGNMSPSWSKSLKNLSKAYHIHEWTVYTGLNELEDMDIVGVERAEAAGPQLSDRAPNRYLVNRLRSQEEIADGWQRLESRFGQEAIKKARSIAGMVGSANSQKSAELIAAAMAAQGDDAVEDAAREVKKLRKQNPHRNVRYMLGIVRASQGK